MVIVVLIIAEHVQTPRPLIPSHLPSCLTRKREMSLPSLLRTNSRPRTLAIPMTFVGSVLNPSSIIPCPNAIIVHVMSVPYGSERYIRRQIVLSARQVSQVFMHVQIVNSVSVLRIHNHLSYSPFLLMLCSALTLRTLFLTRTRSSGSHLRLKR